MTTTEPYWGNKIHVGRIVVDREFALSICSDYMRLIESGKFLDPAVIVEHVPAKGWIVRRTVGTRTEEKREGEPA